LTYTIEFGVRFIYIATNTQDALFAKAIEFSMRWSFLASVTPYTWSTDDSVVVWRPLKAFGTGSLGWWRLWLFHNFLQLWPNHPLFYFLRDTWPWWRIHLYLLWRLIWDFRWWLWFFRLPFYWFRFVNNYFLDRSDNFLWCRWPFGWWRRWHPRRALVSFIWIIRYNVMS
jgi:hypothetical protein